MSRLFNGSSDLCTVTALPVNAYPATISLWFKRNVNPTGPLSMFNITDTAAAFNYIDVFINGAASDIASGTTRTSGTGRTSSSSIATTQDTWQNIILLLASATSRRLWLNDGSAAAEDTTSHNWPTALDSMNIGALKINTTGQYFSGRLAHIALWNTALDATARTQLQTLYPSSVSAGSLQGYWAMTENEATLIDSSANLNHMTITGATFDADNPTLSAGTTVKGRRLMLMGMSR